MGMSPLLLFEVSRFSISDFISFFEISLKLNLSIEQYWELIVWILGWSIYLYILFRIGSVVVWVWVVIGHSIMPNEPVIFAK